MLFLPLSLIATITETTFDLNIQYGGGVVNTAWFDILDSAGTSGMRFRLNFKTSKLQIRFRKKTPMDTSWESPIDNTFLPSLLNMGANNIKIASTGERRDWTSSELYFWIGNLINNLQDIQIIYCRLDVSQFMVGCPFRLFLWVIEEARQTHVYQTNV